MVCEKNDLSVFQEIDIEIEFKIDISKERFFVNKKQIFKNALDLDSKQKLKSDVALGLKERQSEYGAVSADFHNAQSSLLDNNFTD